MAEYDDSFSSKETWFLSSYLYDPCVLWYLVPGVSWASLPWSLYLVPSDQDKLVTTWLYICCWKKSLLPCLSAFLQKKTKPRCLSETAFLPLYTVCSDAPSVWDQGPRSPEQSAFPLLDFLAQPFTSRLWVCLGLNTVGFCFLFSFVLKAEVLKGGGITPVAYMGQDPHIDQRSGMEGREEELGR